jgi:hypothetical protein
MEIKDILSELITVATATLNERGCPENFDLEDFISAIEDYYEELDEIVEFARNKHLHHSVHISIPVECFIVELSVDIIDGVRVCYTEFRASSL